MIDPHIADKIISFGTDGGPARISYSVPLPGHQEGRRLVPIDLGLSSTEWLNEATDAGRDLQKELDLRPEPRGGYAYNPIAATLLFREALAQSGASLIELAPIDQAIGMLRDRVMSDPEVTPAQARNSLMALTREAIMNRAIVRRATGGAVRLVAAETASASPPTGEALPVAEAVRWTDQPPGSTSEPSPSPKPTGVPELDEYLAALATGTLLLPRRSWAGGIDLLPAGLFPQSAPQFFVVEVYGITSLPGEYGLGRTLKTFTLLPGETTEITVRTWRTSRAQLAKTSTIVDSFSSEAADRFSTRLTSELSESSHDETTDKFKWNAGGGGGIDLGIVSFGGSGGVDSENQHHAARDSFSKQMANAVVEHANEANASREISVSSTSEHVDEQGEETTTVRTIRNVNMRRTLNFVFRELNQAYHTRIHLLDTRIGFANGRFGSWRETELAGLRRFFAGLVAPAKVDDVCSRIVKYVAVAFDSNDVAVPVLETLTTGTDGLSRAIASAQGDQAGSFAPPTDRMMYRFKPGPLGKQDGPTVPGVVVEEADVVLRTDSAVVEALLGQADALDVYALEKQAADAEAQTNYR